MELKEVFALDCIKLDVQCSSKKRALEIIAELASEKIAQSPQKIFESMLNREKMGSTGIGHGIAVPHGKLANTNKAVCIFIRTQETFNYDATDNQPVDTLIALLIPEEQTELHLDTLTFIAKKLCNKETCKQLRTENSTQAIYDLFTGSSLCN